MIVCVIVLSDRGDRYLKKDFICKAKEFFMIQVLWHGRGGQGAFTASRLLGSAFALKDSHSYALAFPSFGPERRGAPIRAFTKLDSKPIGNRSEIGKADFVIFLDETLFDGSAFEQLNDGGKIIIATKQRIERIL